jgi:hypothetical protein
VHILLCIQYHAADFDSISAQPILKPSKHTPALNALVSALDTSFRARLRKGDIPAMASSILLETPLQKYQRLLAETTALESQLHGLEATDSLRPSKAPSVNPTVGVWSTLIAGVKSLGARLDGIEARAAAVMLSAPSAEAVASSVVAVPHIDTTAPDLQSAVSSQSQAALVVSSLFDTAALDQRIARIESETGLHFTAVHGQPEADTIVDRLSRIERRVTLMSDAGVLAVAAHAREATTALQALQHQGCTSTSDANGNLTAGRLRKGVETLERWDGVASHLNHLVARLAALQGVHQEAARASQLVDSLTRMTNNLDEQLAVDRQLLVELQRGLADTAASAAANFASLKKRS